MNAIAQRLPLLIAERQQRRLMRRAELDRAGVRQIGLQRRLPRRVVAQRRNGCEAAQHVQSIWTVGVRGARAEPKRGENGKNAKSCNFRHVGSPLV